MDLPDPLGASPPHARCAGPYAYRRDKTPLIAIVTGLLGFESALTHLVLLAIFGNQLWVWALLIVDVYTLLWLVGFYASLVVLPHTLTATTLHPRYYISDLVIPRAAITAARKVHDPISTNGRLRNEPNSTVGYYASGATVAIDLADGTSLTYQGHAASKSVTTLYVTVDDPAALAADFQPAPQDPSHIPPAA